MQDVLSTAIGLVHVHFEAVLAHRCTLFSVDEATCVQYFTQNKVEGDSAMSMRGAFFCSAEAEHM